MGRKLRHMEYPHEIQEITIRCMQSRFLLKPSKRANALILGVIGRAQEVYPDVKLYNLSFASSHGHMHESSKDVKDQADFMTFVNGNIARELGKLYDWHEKFWGKRYTPIAIKDHESLLERIRYLNTHGMKENLVRRPQDWPGINCYRALTRGEPLEGIWINRTAYYYDSRRGKDVRIEDYMIRYEVKLTPYPFLEDLTPEEQQEYFIEHYRQLQEENRQRLIEEGIGVLGKYYILKQNPHDKPRQTKHQTKLIGGLVQKTTLNNCRRFSKSPAPWCHAKDRKRRNAYKQAYKKFEAAFRAAVELLKQGAKEVRFPENCFPPPLYCAPRGAIISFAPG